MTQHRQTSHPTNRSARPGRRLLAACVVGSMAAFGLVVGASPSAPAVAVSNPALALDNGAQARTHPSVALNDCQNRDNGNPDVVGLSLPTRVDVRHASQVVRFDVNAIDTGGPGPASGLAVGAGHQYDLYLELVRPDQGGGPFVYLSRHHHRLTGAVTIPRGTIAGRWSIYIELVDKAGNRVTLDSAALQSRGLPSTFRVLSKQITTAPVLTAFSFTPRSVDTRARAKFVTFTARVRTDTPITYFRVSADGPGHDSSTPPADAYLEKVSGRPHTYRGSMRIRSWRGAGTVRWRVLSVFIAGDVGSSTSLNYRKLGAAGFPRSFRVTSRTDLKGPELQHFDRTPASVDIRTGSGSVQVTLRATDRASGISYVQVIFADPQEGGRFAVGAVLHRVSGSPQHGTWTGTVLVPHCELGAPGSFPGEVFFHDFAGNYSGAEFVSDISVVSSDHSFPDVNVQGAILSGPLDVTFDDVVNGITTTSATVRQGNPYDAVPGPLVPGSWSCTSVTGPPTDCVTGNVSGAEFTPSADFVSGPYFLTLNPEHSLGVRDTAGNAPRRHVASFTVS